MKKTLVMTSAAALILGMAVAAPISADAGAKAHWAESDTTPITVAIAGDSISARAGNWTTFVNDPQIDITQNWSVSGYTSGQELALVQPTDVDVLVVEVGVNDVNAKESGATITNNIASIVAKVGARHVLVLMTPPSKITKDATTGQNRQAGQSYANQAIEASAQSHGWLVGDPWISLRYYSNQIDYNSAYTDDGVHPNAAGVQIAYPVIENLIREADLGGGN